MSEFVDFIPDLFREFGEVSCRKMFGGYGVFYDGIMFGLVADDILYLKVDSTSAIRFQKLDLPQFEYPKGDKMVKLSYFQAPDVIYDDSAEAILWARRSYETAFQATKAKKKR